MLWSGVETLYYTYVRRLQDPPIERRYTLVLAAAAESEAIVADALVRMAAGRRAYGETVLTPALGVPLLEALRPFGRRCLLVEMRRWSTVRLREALEAAGFTSVRSTAHPGELGRHFAREALRAGSMERLASLFADATASLGRMAGALPGEAMVVAVR